MMSNEAYLEETTRDSEVKIHDVYMIRKGVYKSVPKGANPDDYEMEDINVDFKLVGYHHNASDGDYDALGICWDCENLIRRVYYKSRVFPKDLKLDRFLRDYDGFFKPGKFTEIE